MLVCEELILPELLLVRVVPDTAGVEPALEELCILFWLRPPAEVPRLGRSLPEVCPALPLPGVGGGAALPLSGAGGGVALPLPGAGGGAALPLPGAGGGTALPLPPRGAMPPKKCPPAYPPANGRGAE